MFNIFKKLADFRQKRKKIAQEKKATNEYRGMFEEAFSHRAEQALFTATTQRFTRNENSLREIVSKPDPDLMNQKQQHKHQVFKQQLLARYNEKEIVEMLQNNPQEFFIRGWCYPDATPTTFFGSNADIHSNLATCYKWNFNLPEQFWDKPENVALFGEAAMQFWHNKTNSIISHNPNKVQLQALQQHIVGFEASLNNCSGAHYRKIQEQAKQIVTTLPAVTNHQQATNNLKLLKQLQSKSDEYNKARSSIRFNDVLSNLQFAARKIQVLNFPAK